MGRALGLVENWQVCGTCDRGYGNYGASAVEETKQSRQRSKG